MVNVEVQEFKIKIDNREYTFRLDFIALLKFDKKYGQEGLELFNKFLGGNSIYECIIKILSCACVEKEFTEEEIAKMLPFNFKTMKLFDEITVALIQGILQDKEESKGKN